MYNKRGKAMEKAELEQLYETDSESKHPLAAMLCHYCDTFTARKQSHEDLDNLNFHRQHGLSVSVPNDWPIVECTKSVIRTLLLDGRKKVIIIYPSTPVYQKISDSIAHMGFVDEPDLLYFAWQEIYVAMDRAGKDNREIQRFRQLLQEADLVLFFGAPLGIPEVVDQVRGFCEGCLIILGV